MMADDLAPTPAAPRNPCQRNQSTNNDGSTLLLPVSRLVRGRGRGLWWHLLQPDRLVHPLELLDEERRVAERIAPDTRTQVGRRRTAWQSRGRLDSGSAPGGCGSALFAGQTINMVSWDGSRGGGAYLESQRRRLDETCQ